MERFCGAVGQHVKNRRNPYAGLDRRVRDIAQLQMTKLKYGLTAELSPKHSVVNIKGEGLTFKDGPCGFFYLIFLERNLLRCCAKDFDYVLLPPKRKLEIDSRLRKKLAAALVTRYSPDDPRMKISMATASKYIPTSVHQWGQAQIRNGGDRFKCRAMLKGQRHARDCTYVKVSTTRPVFAHRVPLVNHNTTSMKLRLIFMNAKSTRHR